MLTYMVPNVLEIYLYFFLWNLYIATIYGSSSSYMDSSGKRDFNSVFTLFVTSSIDSHVLLCLYGSKSGLLSLNNIWFLMCAIQMKQALRVALSSPDTKTCFKSQDYSFSTVFSKKQIGFKYLKPRRLFFIADTNLSLYIARTNLDVMSTSISSFTFNNLQTCPKISTTTWTVLRILILRKGMWFNSNVTTSLNPLL